MSQLVLQPRLLIMSIVTCVSPLQGSRNGSTNLVEPRSVTAGDVKFGSRVVKALCRLRMSSSYSPYVQCQSTHATASPVGGLSLEQLRWRYCEHPICFVSVLSVWRTGAPFPKDEDSGLLKTLQEVDHLVDVRLVSSVDVPELEKPAKMTTSFSSQSST